jgi:hypothetical protein
MTLILHCGSCLSLDDGIEMTTHGAGRVYEQNGPGSLFSSSMSTTKCPSTVGSSLDPTLEDGSLIHDGYEGTLEQDKHGVPVLKTTKKSSRSSISLHDVLDDEAWSKCPHNPLTWSTSKKWTMASIVSLYTFVSYVLPGPHFIAPTPPMVSYSPISSPCRPLASSMLAPGLPAIAIKYNITNTTLTALPLRQALSLSIALRRPLTFPFQHFYPCIRFWSANYHPAIRNIWSQMGPSFV